MPADHGTPNTEDERGGPGCDCSLRFATWADMSIPTNHRPMCPVRQRLEAQGEDHEAAWPPERLMCSEHEDRKAIAYTARCAECSREFMAAPSPSRDGTVAVEDVRPFVVGAMREARAVLESESDVAAKARALRLLNDALGRLSRPFGVSERTERIHDQATKEEER